MRAKKAGLRSGCMGALMGALVLGLLGTARAEEEEHDFEVVDSTKVYYGDKRYPDAPAVILADDVWAEIPEYKKIIDDDLDEDDPEYHILMRKATERFEEALETEAKREGYDVIAEVAAVVSDTGKTIPDATKDLIELVSRG